MFGGLPGGFKASKCKTALSLTMSRVKLLRNKRENALKQMRRDIASLLASGQEPSAQIRVENIMREQNVLAAYDVLELYCELIVVRLPIIESQKECPPDLREALASVIFAAPRCADLPELMQARHSMQQKYGKDFLAAADELRPGCAVSRIIIEKLSVHAPPGGAKLKLLTEIAEEGGLKWDSSATEAALLRKPKLDLLDAPQPYRQEDKPPSDDSAPSAPLNTKRVEPEAPPFDPNPDLRYDSGGEGDGEEDKAMSEYQRKRGEEREKRKALIRNIVEEATKRGQRAMEVARSATRLTQGEEEEEEGGRRDSDKGGKGGKGGEWNGEEGLPRGYVRGPLGGESGGRAGATGTNFDDFVAHSGKPPHASWGSGSLGPEVDYAQGVVSPPQGQGSDMDDLDARFRSLRDRSGHTGHG